LTFLVDIQDAEDEDKLSIPHPGDGGYFLHSWKIGFPHPKEDGIWIDVVCPIPPEFSTFMSEEAWKKYSEKKLWKVS